MVIIGVEDFVYMSLYIRPSAQRILKKSECTIRKKEKQEKEREKERKKERGKERKK